MINSIRKKLGLTVALVIMVFLILIASLLLSGVVALILHMTGVIDFMHSENQSRGFGFPYFVFVPIMLLSIVIGTTMAWAFSKKALKPIRRFIEATHKVADGDFSVRLDVRSIYELEELSSSFNKMTHELSTIETLRNDFINNFSHEFKTPIVSIRGFARLLKDKTLSETDRQEYLDIIIAESERLSLLSENVLILANYENLEIIADRTDFRLDEQLRKAVIQTEPKWLSKNINVNVEMEEVTYSGSADLLQQVLLNLIDNAIKFTEPGGTIEISLTDSDDMVCLTIKDDGIGMDEQTKARIFDKFYQGDVSRSGAGNGLGLAIVKRIVDLCGGRIEVESEPHVGSKFTVWLP